MANKKIIKQISGVIPNFQLKPAFEKLQSEGVFGAVRVEGQSDVFTVGKGGRKETPTSFKERFGTLSQKGIVDVVSAEQAKLLGIDAAPKEEMVLTPEMLNQEPLKIPTDIDAFESSLAPFLEDIEELKKQQAEEMQKLTDIRGELGGVSEIREEELAELGFRPKEFFAELISETQAIGKLQAEFDTLKAATDKALLAQEGIPGLTISEVTGKQGRIKRQANSRLAALSANIQSRAAMVAVRQGNFGKAQSFVNQAVKDFTFEKQQDLKLLERFISDNDKILAGLEEGVRDSVEAAFEKSEKELEDIKKEKDEIMKLMIDHPRAGIDITMSKEEAVQAVVRVGEDPELETQITEAGGRRLLINKQTGATIRDLGTAGLDGGDRIIPKGLLTTQQIARLAAAGIEADLAREITNAILQRVDLETIRQNMRQAGIDPKLLDRYDSIVGISDLLGEESGGANLDKLIAQELAEEE